MKSVPVHVCYSHFPHGNPRKRGKEELIIAAFLTLFVLSIWKEMITSGCLLSLRDLVLKSYVPSEQIFVSKNIMERFAN